MAKPKSASWTKLLIQLGDGAMPTEVFTAPCALVTKGISFSADTSDSNLPDCDNPDLPSWVERTIRTLSAEVTGSGRLALSSLTLWRTWMFSGAGKNCRIKIDVPLADNGGFFSGSFKLTRFNLTGNESDGKIGVDVTIVSDGEVGWTAASA